jgi:hypothetical protein
MFVTYPYNLSAAKHWKFKDDDVMMIMMMIMKDNRATSE